MVLLTSHDGGSCPRTPEPPRKYQAQLGQLLLELRQLYIHKVSRLFLLTELGFPLPSEESLPLMFLLPTHRLDAKNKDMSELGLYRLLSADGEQSSEAVGLRTSCSQLIIPPRCPLKATFPVKHHPLCTSPILFQCSEDTIRAAATACVAAA